MSFSKENKSNMSFYVKPEPRDGELPPLNPLNGATNNVGAFVAKPEPNVHDGALGPLIQPKPENQDDVKASVFQQPRPVVRYTTYQDVSEIVYSPEYALKEGLNMIESLQKQVDTLMLGKLREEVWKREIQNLRGQSSPTTLIAVCGATGAGKSSILNAVLDDNIVPTSGMRACTAVVTEIAYHKKSSIDGDVAFLSEAEWRQELAVLLPDLTDENGNVKRTNDLKSDAGVAWQKVHAVYPNISVEQLVKMSADEIINVDKNIRAILGTTKKIVAKDSKIFGKEIAKYIDSKDQKRGNKKKEKEKEKPKEKSLMDKVREAAGQSSAIVRGNKDTQQSEANAPAFWPLIRQVNVRCPAKALSTGAILVDLPGVADANAARNTIAKDYMKKANCIWILAPITRAVDDKTAKDLLGDAFKMQLMMDGNYDDHCITFIASKCDDISCSEVIHALRLYDDPELTPLEDRIGELTSEIHEHTKRKSASEKQIKGLDKEVKDLEERMEDHENHIAALENGEPFESKFAAKPAKSNGNKKRKNKRKGKQAAKRRRSDSDDEDGDITSESESESEEESDLDSNAGSQADSDEESALEVEGLAMEEETEDTLKAKISSIQDVIKAFKAKLKTVKGEKREAADRISGLEKELSKVQKQKNAFCSKKRSEFSRDVLKEDFRTGLKELDDAEAESRDPDNFDPSISRRDYNAIDLPVFTCSSRDYVRLKDQVKGDGQPSCFSNVQDTGIPDLQAWCHELTIASRERGVRNFLTHLGIFAKTVQTYVEGVSDVTAADRESLREQWESRGFNEPEIPAAQLWNGLDLNDPLRDVFDRLGAGDGNDLYAMNQPKTKVDVDGQPVGVAPRLCMEFIALIDRCVVDLKEKFTDGLEEKCKSGATSASDAALPTLDEFVGSMHWATYRATLRRHGSWRRDLNVELITPFTRSIAHSWGQMFESDLFGQFETSTMASIDNLLKEFEESAAKGLKDRAHLQAEACLEEARAALQKTMGAVREKMNTEQKEISRLLSPHVQAQLIEAYDEAMEFRGTGSVARQKAWFRAYIDDNKGNIFDGSAEVLLDRLDQAAVAIGEALESSLGELAKKVEVNLAVLWEAVRDDPGQAKAREYTVDVSSNVQAQTQMWLQAAALKKSAEASMDVDMAA